MKKYFSVMLFLCGLCLLNGCAGGNSQPPPTAASAATHFSVTAPATATAGTAFQVTVTALDASNNLANTYSGTVHFTSTDGQAALPHDSTLANGTAQFKATLSTTGSQSIKATDTIATSITGSSGPISVNVLVALTITSGAPPSGTVCVKYVPLETEYLECHWNFYKGIYMVCGPCSLPSGCASLPHCKYYPARGSVLERDRSLWVSVSRRQVGCLLIPGRLRRALHCLLV